MGSSSRSRRRTVLGLFALGTAGAAAGLSMPQPVSGQARRVSRGRPAPKPAVVDGLLLPVNVSDRARQIQGYASATSVNAGDAIDFHVTVARPQRFTVTIIRAGADGHQVSRSGELDGHSRPVPKPDPATGLVDCDWPVSWTLPVPATWDSGLYMAIFESHDGHRSSTPFVVRADGRRSDFLVVVPFTTYAAYNMWPLDGSTGRNLYRGYQAGGKVTAPADRARRVSFNRPFSNGGRPSQFDLDVSAARWIAANGYDVTFATSVDLHEGRVDPANHRALVFSGHDEYWSGAMRAVVEKAVGEGTHCAFLAANNIYWNIRLEADPAGRSGRVVTCYKDLTDPAPDAVGPTVLWRHLGTGYERAEARLLGVQYNGIPRVPMPLVVREPGHWLWAGTGLRDGDVIEKLVGGEADGCFHKIPMGYAVQRTLLSHSPYTDNLGRGDKVQNTSLSVTPQGTLMFTAGTFHWPRALVDSPYTDSRIQRATRNLFDRMRA